MVDEVQGQPVNIWLAHASSGKPVCVGSGGGPFTVNLFLSRKGKLKGVEVFDVQTLKFVGVFGKTPKRGRAD